MELSTKPHVRWMIRRDMDEVLQIEKASFEHAWSEDDFFRCLRSRDTIGMIAETRDGSVIGYMVYQLHAKRLELLNFAVHPDWRRAGVGSHMVAKLVAKLASHRRPFIGLMVRETNLDAQLFFAALGFRCTEIVRRFYEDSGEDAYRMVYFKADDRSGE